MSKHIKDVMKVLVRFQNILESKAIELRKLNEFTTVSRTSSFIEYPNDGCPAISSSLHADLSQPIDNNLHCLSLSITFFFNERDTWEIHAELGWSSYDEGFIDHKLVEEEYQSWSELLDNVNPLTRTLIKDLDILVGQIGASCSSD